MQQRRRRSTQGEHLPLLFRQSDRQWAGFALVCFAQPCSVFPLLHQKSSCSDEFIFSFSLSFCSEIDTSYFVLTVDLWSADGTHEVNLVRHSASSPSISTASASSFPPPPTVLPYPYQPGYPQGGYPNLYSTPGYNQQGMQYGGSQQSPYYPMNSPYYPQGGGVVQHPLSHVQAPPTGMFTRNLIGSLSASAFQLTDVENRLGIWFILQDLSVRTEGNFR